MIQLSYTDSRFGDTFNISIDEKDGTFIGAFRFVDRIGADPIEYNRLDEIPAIYRAGVEATIRRHRNSSNSQKP